VFGIEAVQLQHELIVEAEALVVRAAVIAAEAKEALIPAAAGFDVGHGDKGLGPHGSSPSDVRRSGDEVVDAVYRSLAVAGGCGFLCGSG
jgi:hypothetical protein